MGAAGAVGAVGAAGATDATGTAGATGATGGGVAWTGGSSLLSMLLRFIPTDGLGAKLTA